MLIYIWSSELIPCIFRNGCIILNCAVKVIRVYPQSRYSVLVSRTIHVLAFFHRAVIIPAVGTSLFEHKHTLVDHTIINIIFRNGDLSSPCSNKPKRTFKRDNCLRYNTPHLGTEMATRRCWPSILQVWYGAIFTHTIMKYISL